MLRMSAILFKLFEIGRDKSQTVRLYRELPPLPEMETSWPNDAKAQKALIFFREHLQYFSISSLRLLYKMILKGYRPGATWDNNPLSFRLGPRGANKDYFGKKGNAFTIYWRRHWDEIDPRWLLPEIRAAIECKKAAA